MRRTMQCLSALVLCAIGFAAGRLTLTQPTIEFTPANRADVLRTALHIQPPGDADDDEGEEGEEGMDAEAMERMMEAGQPGEHHAALKPLEGNWKGFVRITMAPGEEPMEMPATIHREWILDGHFLQESVTSESGDGFEFHGMGIVGYNNIDGVYESMWIDNTITAMMTESGAYNQKNKTFHFWGAHRDPMSGHIAMSSSELDLSNPNRHVMKGTQIGPDGSPYQNFYGVFERVK